MQFFQKSILALCTAATFFWGSCCRSAVELLEISPYILHVNITNSAHGDILSITIATSMGTFTGSTFLVCFKHVSTKLTCGIKCYDNSTSLACGLVCDELKPRIHGFLTTPLNSIQCLIFCLRCTKIVV